MLDKTKCDIIRATVIDLVHDVRQELSDCNIGDFNLVIQATGRTATGDAKLSFTVGSCQYGSKNVASNDLAQSLEEVLRRKDFERAHATLLLSDGNEPMTHGEPEDFPF